MAASPATTLLRRSSDPVRPGLGPEHSIYWRDTEPVDPGPPLRGDLECDVCVVGAGYTGMWTAHFLKRAEPGLNVHLLEADYAGAGASGHNDGFVTPTIGHGLHSVLRAWEPERAAAAYQAVGRSILELRRFCRKAPEADFSPSGFYLVATNRGQMARLRGDVERARRMGFDYELLDAAEIQERISSRRLTGALKTPGALVNPHRLARALFRHVGEQGVVVHERTPALGFGRDGDRYRVQAPCGSVTARRLLLATNAYQHEWGGFRNQVKPVWSYALVSEPLTEAQMQSVSWPGGEGFVEARNFIVFVRPVAGNRILVGGGPAPYRYGRDMDVRHMRHDRIHGILVRALRDFFPGWGSLRFHRAYGGCIAITRDLLPRLGRRADGVFFGYGYCGNGIAMSHTAGRTLADLILERNTEATRLPFVGKGEEPAFPPEPVAYAGAKALSALLGLQDRYPRLSRWQLV
ncbi:MAG TPA: FAD-binding oxidoreductase [Solirubrobacterales bacterium]